MGFTSFKDLVKETEINGKYWQTSFQKISPAFAFTAGRIYDLSMTTGQPRVNVYPGGLRESTKLWYRSSGNIYHGQNVSPDTKHVLEAEAFGVVATSVNAWLMLCDYIMFYPLFDMDDDSYQAADNVITLPRYTDGVGVQAFLVTTSDLGANTGVYVRVTYQNSDGVMGRISQPMLLTPSMTALGLATAGPGAANIAYGGPFINLYPGEKGIRRIEGLQLSAGIGGGWCTIVLCKPLMSIPIRAVGVVSERSMVLDTPMLPRVQDEAFLNWLFRAGGALAAASTIGGYLKFGWG